jgi:hypothetical protein
MFLETFTYTFQAKAYIEKEYGITIRCISTVLEGKQKSAKGFTFKYK